MSRPMVLQSMMDISEHARDVLLFTERVIRSGSRCVLAVVVHVEGSSSRAVGSMMSIGENGQFAGYVSNGCVDGDIALQAQQALHSDRPRRVRYGIDSPYFDIKLPCGGAIEVIIIPNPPIREVTKGITQLTSRCRMHLELNEVRQPYFQTFDHVPETIANDSAFRHIYVPPLHIGIAGSGHETLAMARLARAAHYDVSIWSPDSQLLEDCEVLGAQIQRLKSFNDIPTLHGDSWAAFVSLFHEHVWEPGLLMAALETDMFYIGAMGSKRTHAARLDELRRRGVSEDAFERLRGPIGLIPSTRDAAKLALSSLAEILSLYRSDG